MDNKTLGIIRGNNFTTVETVSLLGGIYTGKINMACYSDGAVAVYQGMIGGHMSGDTHNIVFEDMQDNLSGGNVTFQLTANSTSNEILVQATNSKNSSVGCSGSYLASTSN